MSCEEIENIAGAGGDWKVRPNLIWPDLFIITSISPLFLHQFCCCLDCVLFIIPANSDVWRLKPEAAGRPGQILWETVLWPSQHTKVFIRVTIYCSSRLRMRMKNHLFVQPVCPGPNYPPSIIITCHQISTPFIYQYIYSLSVFSDSPVKTLCWDKEREETFLSLPSLSPCLHSPDSACLYSQYQTWFELNLMLLPAQVFEKSFLNSISGNSI